MGEFTQNAQSEFDGCSRALDLSAQLASRLFSELTRELVRAIAHDPSVTAAEKPLTACRRLVTELLSYDDGSEQQVDEQVVGINKLVSVRSAPAVDQVMRGAAAP